MAVITLTQPRYTVRTKNGSSGWVHQPTWLVESYETKLMAVGEAVFRVPATDGASTIARLPGAPASVSFTPSSFVGQLVEVLVEDGTVEPILLDGVMYGIAWVGVIEEIESEYAGGLQWHIVRALHLNTLLHRRTVRYAFARYGDAAGEVQRIEAPIFGEHFPDMADISAAWSPPTSWAEGSVRPIDRRAGKTRFPWHPYALVYHLMVANWPAFQEDFSAQRSIDCWTLQDYATENAIDTGVTAYDPRGKTLAQCASEILGRYGYWWRLEAVDLHTTPKANLRFGSGLAAQITIPPQTLYQSTFTTTIPAQTNRWPLRISRTNASRYDELIVRGGGHYVICTLVCQGNAWNTSQGNSWGSTQIQAASDLVPDWTDAEEAAANAWMDSSSNPIRPQGAGKAWLRFRLREGWDGVPAWDGSGSMPSGWGLPNKANSASSTAYGDYGSDGTITREDAGLVYPAQAWAFADWLGFTGGDTALTAADGPNGLRPFCATNEAWALYIDNAGYPAIEIDDGADGRSLRAHLRSGFILRITLAVRLPTPFFVSWRRPEGQWRANPHAQILAIDRPDAITIRVLRGTRWRTGLPTANVPTSDLILRNDLDALRGTLAAMRAVFGDSERRVWELTMRGEAANYEVGRFVDTITVGAAVQVQSPIAGVAVRIDHDAGVVESTIRGETFLPSVEGLL